MRHLLKQLRSKDLVWTPHARLARALRAGVSAGIKLNSGGAVEPSPATPFPNTVFVVLRGAPGFDPCVTSEASCYFQVVQDQSTDPPRPFHRLLVERFSRLCHSSRGRSLGDWGKSSMATSSAGRAITEEGVLKQLRALNPEAIMAIRDLCSQNHRAGGVMFVCRKLRRSKRFEEFFTADGETYALNACVVQLESAKGKHLGEGQGLLVDAPWEALSNFRCPLSLRGDPLRLLIRFTCDNNVCRPSRESVLLAADTWISQLMDEDTAQEYATCVEDFVPQRRWPLRSCWTESKS